MKAIVYKKFGSHDVLKLGEIDKPVPKDNEVLVKVYASSVNAFEWHMMTGKPFLIRLMGDGFLKPKKQILGGDIAGRIEAFGKNVKNFKVGDEVFGDTSGGGYAEYVCATEDVIALKPSNLTFEESAAVPIAALTALQALRDKGEIKPGQKVLITGASGGVGSYAVQIAKSYETEVTAVCRTGSVEMVRSIGADCVIDFTKEDYISNKEHYDLVIDAAAYRKLSDMLGVLKPGGIYVLVGGSITHLFKVMIFGKSAAKRENKKVKFFVAKSNNKDLTFLKNLIEAEKVKPVIDKIYSLSEVPEAMRYFEEEHVLGKLAITVGDDNKILHNEIAAEGKN